MRRLRVRHHTNDAGLEGIRAEYGIRVSRGWGDIASGIHVEVEPFGTARSAGEGQPGPKHDMGCTTQGAYVEFDAPSELSHYDCGPRNTAIIPAVLPLSLQGLNPEFVKVRRHWFEFWRKKA